MISLLDNKNGPQYLNINPNSKTCRKHESEASFSVSGQIFEKIEHLCFNSELNLKAVNEVNWAFFRCFMLLSPMKSKIFLKYCFKNQILLILSKNYGESLKNLALINGFHVGYKNYTFFRFLPF